MNVNPKRYRRFLNVRTDDEFDAKVEAVRRDQMLTTGKNTSKTDVVRGLIEKAYEKIQQKAQQRKSSKGTATVGK